MAAPNPTDYAIVVGVDRYGYIGEEYQLQGCVNDAVLFHRWLVDPGRGGLDPDPAAGRITLIRSDGADNLQPVKARVVDAIKGLLKTWREKGGAPLGRRLYLWFSGHGIQGHTVYEECALLMADGDLESLDRSVAGLRTFNSFWKCRVFEEVVLIMDCCRDLSGLIDVELGYTDCQDAEAAKKTRRFHALASAWASRTGERLMPDPLDPLPDGDPNKPQLHHGIFTHAVLEGLTHAIDDTGLITSESLDRFVCARVAHLVPGSDDEPDVKYWPRQSDRLLVFGPGRKSRVTITLANPAAGLQLYYGKGQRVPVEVQPAPVAGAPGRFTVDVTFGRYVLEVSAPGAGPTRKDLHVFGDLHVQL